MISSHHKSEIKGCKNNNSMASSLRAAMPPSLLALALVALV